MSNVTLSIAGRSYKVACAEGEESHIQKLGTSINAKLSEIPNISNQSEPRALLFAALLMADELHEAKKGGKPAPEGDDNSTIALENLADQLESLATRLESAASTP